MTFLLQLIDQQLIENNVWQQRISVFLYLLSFPDYLSAYPLSKSRIKITEILWHIFSEFIYIFLQNFEWQFAHQTGGIQVRTNHAEPLLLLWMEIWEKQNRT